MWQGTLRAARLWHTVAQAIKAAENAGKAGQGVASSSPAAPRTIGTRSARR